MKNRQLLFSSNRISVVLCPFDMHRRMTNENVHYQWNNVDNVIIRHPDAAFKYAKIIKLAQREEFIKQSSPR